MSKAFTKEDAPDVPLLVPPRAALPPGVPNYVTPRGLRLLRAEGLPLPVTNRPAGGRRVDCRWHDRRLTVELDSFRFHNSRRAWERDRQREREAYARGDDFRRYTWTDVTEAPAAMLRELDALLRARYPDAA